MNVGLLCLFVGACGGGGGSSPAPILVSDLSATTNEDVSIEIDVSANNIVSGAISVIVESSPSFGSLAVDYPVVVYAPNSNANGVDSFRVRLQDGVRQSRVFTIDLTINPINDAPEVDTNPPMSIAAFTEYVFDLQTTDADDDPVTYVVENLPAWLQFDASEGVLRGTPNNAQVDLYENIEISVSDGLETTLVPIFDINVEFEPLIEKAFSFESIGMENPNFTGLLVFGDTAVAKLQGVDRLNQRVVALCAINLLTMELIWSFVEQINPGPTGALVDFAKYSGGFVSLGSGQIKGYDLAGDLQFDQVLPADPNGIFIGGVTELENGDFLISVRDDTDQVPAQTAAMVRLDPTAGVVSTFPQSAFYWQLAGTSPNELYGGVEVRQGFTPLVVHKLAETTGVIWTGLVNGAIAEQIEPILVLADGSVQFSYIGFASGVANTRFSSDGVQLFNTISVGDFSAVATRDDGSVEFIALERREKVYSRFAADGSKTARIFLGQTKFDSIRKAAVHPLYNVLLANEDAVLRSLSPAGGLR